MKQKEKEMLLKNIEYLKNNDLYEVIREFRRLIAIKDHRHSVKDMLKEWPMPSKSNN